MISMTIDFAFMQEAIRLALNARFPGMLDSYDVQDILTLNPEEEWDSIESLKIDFSVKESTAP
jgi:hypothetical protein